MNPYHIHDVVIAGAGPAGLSAALLLGRCMRDVVLCDGALVEPDVLPPSGGFTAPGGRHLAGLFHTGREGLAKLETLTHLPTPVDHVRRSIAGFTVRCGDGASFDTHCLLIASDLVAKLPEVKGATKFYGTSLHQYPYSDGWDDRGRQFGVLGGDANAAHLASQLLTWSDRVTLFSNGEGVSCITRRLLAETGIRVESGRVAALHGQDGRLEEVLMDDRSAVPCEVMFFCPPSIHHADLAARLGCDVKRIAGCEIWQPGSTGVEGLFFAGNPLKPAEMSVVSAADGVKAAEAIHNWLKQAHPTRAASKRSA